ncbi:hypothetical protein [Glutamicibacter ardleyensis]|uniref:Uncharacterized protein n=1 Tax=Glutamicibacter ardleyensis TaxID=225894 RepID=A0ABQ2DVE0_9MICC|nr:hypothetical protein [Glutamicibacter ardleyensis]GGJ74407.1 hypothetical protein GCM10007173_36690 [Glutamicibacter ardleyensis]
MAQNIKIRNISPLGDLDVPLLGQIVKYGETVSLPKAAADKLLAQDRNFEQVGGN